MNRRSILLAIISLANLALTLRVARMYLKIHAQRVLNGEQLESLSEFGDYLRLLERIKAAELGYARGRYTYQQADSLLRADFDQIAWRPWLDHALFDLVFSLRERHQEGDLLRT